MPWKWKNPVKIGTQHADNYLESFSIMLCNYIAWMLILVCSIYSVYFMSRANFWNSFPYLFYVSIGGICLYLNHKKYFFANRILTLLSANSIIFYSLIYVGYSIQSQMYLTILVATSFLLFSKPIIPIIHLVLICILHVIVYNHIQKYGPIDEGVRINLGEYLNFIFSVTGAALLSYLFYKEQEKYFARNKGALEEIRNKNLRLSDKNEQLENIIFITSHNLQEPLVNIQNMVNLIIPDLDKEKERTGRSIKYLEEATHRMREMIQSIMDYARIGAEKEKEWVDTKLIVEEVLSDLQVQISAVDAQIHIGQLPSLPAFRCELFSLFQNLISNSLKFRHKDRQLHITISSQALSNGYQFAVEDNGIGLSEQDVEGIFHMFKRLHTKDEISGTGIGLAHCKKVVELHEGNIWAEAGHPHGTVFIFTLKGEEVLQQSPRKNPEEECISLIDI